MQTRDFCWNLKNVNKARALRKRQTTCEEILWKKLRARRFLGLKFRRQVPIGRYIADFACMEMRLIIEVDGSSHIGREEQDLDRDMFFIESGYSVLRFSNRSVHENLAGILSTIAEVTQNNPLPKGEVG